MHCADGCGAPGAEIGYWRTADGPLGGSGGCSCAAVWRSGEVGRIGWGKGASGASMAPARLRRSRALRSRRRPSPSTSIIYTCYFVRTSPLVVIPDSARNLLSPNSRTRVRIVCVVPMVAVRQGPRSAIGARRMAPWVVLVGVHVRQFGGRLLGGEEGGQEIGK